MKEALSAPSARVAVERLMQGTVNLSTDPRNPRGCLFVQGALAGGGEGNCARQPSAIHRRISTWRTWRVYVVTVVHGIAVQAAGEAPRAQLRRVIRTAMRAWPQ